MSTTMVTARMDEFKKIRANAVLKKYGKTHSSVINELYDIIISENSLPWKEKRCGIDSMTQDEIKEAYDFVRSIPVSNSRFSTMSDEEIRKERLQAKGLA